MRSRYLALIFIALLSILLVLIYPLYEPDPLERSYQQAYGLEVLPRQVSVLSGIVLQEALPTIAQSPFFAELNEECAQINSWARSKLKQSINLDFLAALHENSETRLCAVELNSRRNRVLKVDQCRPISFELYKTIVNIQAGYQQITTTPYKKVSFKMLKKAVHHPTSIQNINQAIAQSSTKATSELGGLMFIRHDESGEPYIALINIPGRDEQYVESLQRSMDDLNATIQLLRSGSKHFDFLSYEYDAAMRALCSNLTTNQKRKRLDQFLDLYFFMARNTYLPSQAYIFKVLADGLKGDFVGGFHVHPPNNQPSYEDKRNSLIQRVIIIVPTGKGFTLYDLIPHDPKSVKNRVIKVD